MTRVIKDAIIIDQVRANKGGKTFTNFTQAATGVHHSQQTYLRELRRFWDGIVFYNYNVNFFPGGARVILPCAVRNDKRNQRTLLHMLTTHMPTHCIVWGKQNWESLVVSDHKWAWVRRLYGPRKDCECYAVVVDTHRTIFTFIQHPSTAFSSRAWRPMLNTFLSMKSNVT
jgi:hypothetical protein